MKYFILFVAFSLLSVSKTAAQDSVYCKGFSLDTTIPFHRALDFAVMSQSMNCNFNGVIVIPVVVHVIHSGEAEGVGRNINEADIIAQLELTNQEFRKTNVPSGLYPGDAADIEIEFQLARSSPNGMPHNGITRTSWTTVSPPYTKAYFDSIIKPATIWDPDRYLNVWTTSSSEAGGYANFPAFSGLSGQNIMNYYLGTANSEGVVVDYISVNHAFLHTFLTHEIGHYLGLFHTFQGAGLVEQSVNCNSWNGDYCDDTPKTTGHFFTDPDSCLNYNTCGLFVRDMTENFMDYSIPCHQIFTNDQKARMHTALNAIRRPNHTAYNTNEWYGLDTYEPNGSATGSANIFPMLSSAPVDSTINSYIFYNYDYDWYKVNLSGPGTLTFTLSNAPANYDLEIYGANGLSDWLDGSYNTGTTPDQLIYSYNSTSPAVIYVTTYGYNNVSDKCNDYELRLQWQPTSSCVTINASISKTDLSNAGANNGSASVSVSSGSAPYTYLWSNGGTSSSINNLASGTYQVTITGNDGCAVVKSIYVGIQGVPQPYCYGNTVLTAQSGTFSDGSGNAFYANNSYCSWKIDPAINNATVTLSFSSFQLATGDTIIVFDGGNSGSPVLAKFYGTSIPAQVTSSAPAMFVLFKSDGVDSLAGWVANYTSQVLPGGVSIVQYQYWFDNNYAGNQVLNVTPKKVFDLNTSVPVTGLSDGMHVFHIRFKDDNGKWSSVLSNFIIKHPDGLYQAQSITEYEYWYDSDYANRISQTVAPQTMLDLNVSLDMSTISDGMHVLNIRFKDGGNAWSSVLSSFVVKYPSGQNSSKSIAGYEYWFDNNYANKVSQPVTPQVSYLLNSGVDVSSLSHGMHTMHIRFKDDGDFWSSVTSSFFIKNGVTTASTNKIVAYRYWFDTAYTNITTVLLPTPVNPYDLITNVNTSSLNSGSHTIHFQFKDSISLWSGVTNDTFSNVIGPKALFTANDTVLCYSGTVTFTNLSSNANSYQWSFGDGGVSTATNPTHAYTSPGLYTVRLIAVGSGNLRDTLIRSSYVRVVSLNVGVSSNLSICPGDSTVLTATGALTYSWYPSTGLSTTNGASVLAFPATNTSYSVIGTDQYGCLDTAYTSVSITNVVSVSVSPTSSVICNGDSVTLTATGASSFVWSPSSELNASIGGIVIASPSNTTTFNVIGTSTCGNDTQSVLVTVNQVPTANAGNDTAICNGKTVTLLASGGSLYSWSNSVNTAFNTVQPTNTTALVVTVTANGCSASDTVLVAVNPTPIVALNDTFICNGSSISLDAGNSGASYQWNNSSSLQTLQVSAAGVYSVTVVNSANCMASDSSIVTVINNLAVQLYDTSACQGQQIVLDAGFPGYMYQWSNSASTQTIMVGNSGVYKVTVTHPAGCIGIDSATVQIYNKPIADAGADVTVCLGQPVTLNAAGGTSYIWSNAVTSATNTFTPAASADYTVTVQNIYGCSASDTVNVVVNQPPIVTLQSFTDVCDNASTFALTGGSPVGGMYSGVGVSNGTFNPNLAGVGTYTVTYHYTDVNGCSDSAQANINVTSCTGLNSIPNTVLVKLYPNPTAGDVVIEITDFVGQCSISVYGELGQLVSSDEFLVSGHLRNTYDLSRFADGVYTFRISIGDKRETFQVVKAFKD